MPFEDYFIQGDLEYIFCMCVPCLIRTHNLGIASATLLQIDSDRMLSLPYLSHISLRTNYAL